MADGLRERWEEYEEVMKMEQSEDFCSLCGQEGELLCCDTCTAVFHLKCLDPPLKVVPMGSWSCPKCVHPMAEVEKILDWEVRRVGQEEVRQYLVKWKCRSYMHCSWLPEETLEKASKMVHGVRMKLRQFKRQQDFVKDEEKNPVRAEWTSVDRILDVRSHGDGEKELEYLVKWKELGYEEATWEDAADIAPFQAQMNRFMEIQSGGEKKSRNKDEMVGELYGYQVEGMEFLKTAWEEGKNVILGDEMGLGKTVQSIAFLTRLYEEGCELPHLVVAPMSTLKNWEREFGVWGGEVNVVVYVGTSQARAVIRKHEFFRKEVVKFDVLLTSYEMVNADAAILNKFQWGCLIVDEGNRLKSKHSKLYQALQLYHTRHRVLLTGTPLQNNLDELFMLMHFLDADKFRTLDAIHHGVSNINYEEQVASLHHMLAPHLLRRLKRDVLKQLPPKQEVILLVELTAVQKDIYRALLTRNYHLLSTSHVSLNNVVMDLLKLCGHPYLLEGSASAHSQAQAASTSQQSSTTQDGLNSILHASAKLLLLDKMMEKLKVAGHRVLIYSQFTSMLDILEDWLSSKHWPYERIDGKVNGCQRQIRIDRFNAPNSPCFCFLLSTRVGGLGINLASADTIVIYDSDWNPHADLQAMARAHRLGQTSKVMILRLITRGTVEERVMQMSKRKMVLQHLDVGRMKTTQLLNQQQIDDILRYGAAQLFAEDATNKARQAGKTLYDDAAIDRLLDRSQIHCAQPGVSQDDDTDFLHAFKVSNFDYLDEEAQLCAEPPPSMDPHFSTAAYWEKLLKGRFGQQQPKDVEELGKGKRSRKQVMQFAMYTTDDFLSGMAATSSDEEDTVEAPRQVSVPPDSPTTQTSDKPEKQAPVVATAPTSPVPRKRVRRSLPGPPPLMAGDGRSLRILGFNQKQRSLFVQLLMRFGLGDFSWMEFVPRLKPKSPEEIKNYSTLFLSHLAERVTDSPTFSDGVPKEGLRIQDVLLRLAMLHLIRNKVKFVLENPQSPLFPATVGHLNSSACRNTKVWKEKHDSLLLLGIVKHGYGRWQSIIDDADLGLQPVLRLELIARTDVASSKIGVSHVSPVAGGHQHSNPMPLPSETDEMSPETHFIHVDATARDAAEAHLQKRMVEFLKKRVLVMEKMLNAEYHKADVHEDTVARVQTAAEVQSGAKSSNARVNAAVTALAAEEISTHVCDDSPTRMCVAQLYNGMCELMIENHPEAVQTYTGNKSAGLRLRKSLRQLDSLCVDMRNALFGHNTKRKGSLQAAAKGAQRSSAASADAVSDQLDDINAGIDSEDA